MSEAPGSHVPLQPAVPAPEAVRPERAKARHEVDAEGRRPLPVLFEEQAAMRPDAPAVIWSGEEISFGALDRQANAAARLLLDLEGMANRPVAALLGDGPGSILAMLAIMKAGKCYVPLDAAHPPARLARMLEDSGALTILTDARHAPLADTLAGGRRVMNLDAIAPSAPDARPAIDVPPDSLACIIYTSGSTGEPKGVINTHRQISATAEWSHQNVGFTPRDRMAHFSSFAFAGGLKSTTWALAFGAATLATTVQDLHRMARIISEHGVTVVCAPPTVVTHFLNTVPPGRPFPSLRLFYVYGETLHKATAQSLRKVFPSGVGLVNALGMTETCVVREYVVADPDAVDGDVVPVGYAIGDMETFIVGDDGRRLGNGEIGQIAVRGRYISSGYWRKPDATAKRFLPDPEGGQCRVYLSGDLGTMLPDGCLVHLGRQDFQVKIRAHRIEIGEVETALRAHPGVADAVVVAREDTPGEQRLVAYLVPSGEFLPPVSELRAFLEERLPDYMIPAACVPLDALPVTPNGKVDRAALPAPGSGRPALATPYQPPRTSLEEQIAKIWSDALNVREIGVNDNFLDLGGHSLLAARLAALVEREFPVKLPANALFESPTVAAMAVAVLQALAEKEHIDGIAGILDDIDGSQT